MKKLAIIILVILIVLIWMLTRGDDNSKSAMDRSIMGNLLLQISSSPRPSQDENIDKVSVFASGLEVPWAIAFLQSGDMLVTEREGRVRFVSKNGEVRSDPVATLSQVKQIGEGGLQGITQHPQFAQNHFVYLYYTYSEKNNNTLNRVARYTFNNNQFTDEQIIVDSIPGASNHDGGRIKFGPDGYLYITTGDAQEPSLAQDTNSLAGKILRVTDDGNPAPGNPFGSAQGKPFGAERVYSYGHRNPQGITWDASGQLWETEHGPSGLETGNDEFNKIEMGKNYGWPDIRGMKSKSGMMTPIFESGTKDTWAPAGLAYTKGAFYFAGLRGTALYRVTFDGNTPKLDTQFKNEYGRLREVIVGPDGMLYVTTSNRDGRGNPKSGDDKILKINPEKL